MVILSIELLSILSTDKINSATSLAVVSHSHPIWYFLIILVIFTPRVTRHGKPASKASSIAIGNPSYLEVKIKTSLSCSIEFLSFPYIGPLKVTPGKLSFWIRPLSSLSSLLFPLPYIERSKFFISYLSFNISKASRECRYLYVRNLFSKDKQIYMVDIYF